MVQFVWKVKKVNFVGLIRINKFLADAGVSSRRGADALIEEGVVRVNGKVLLEVGVQIDPAKDTVTIKGERVGVRNKECRYVAIYKPAGYVSTVRDSHAEKTVMDLVNFKERVYPVGRLDKDSEGLMFLTNDGDFSLRLTHPRYHVAKTYRVLVKGIVNEGILERFKRGIKLEDGMSSVADIQMISKNEDGAWLEIVLQEGKKRQIRRMCAGVHLYVKRLVRIAIGSVKLGDLREGSWRELTADEVKGLS